MFERLYFLLTLIIAVMLLSQYSVAVVIMLLIVAVPALVFGSYLTYATGIRRNEKGSVAFIVPFVFGCVLILISIKCLTSIYQVFGT